MQGILSALILTLIAGSATGIGGALVLFKKKISSNFLAGALGLSAGVMIFISLAEMYPEAQAMIGIPHGRTFVLIAFLGVLTTRDLILMMISQYVMKLAIEALFGTPLAYAAVAYLRQRMQ